MGAESSMFGTDDLFDQKNLGSVLQCINMLGGVVQDKCPHFDGPSLGVAVHHEVKGDIKRQVGIITQTGGLSNNMEVQKLHTGQRDVCGIDKGEGRLASINHEATLCANKVMSPERMQRLCDGIPASNPVL